MLVYIVIVCIVFLALRDFGGRRFISTVLLLLLLLLCVTYNCDYLKRSTFRFNLIDFQLNTDFLSQFCVFYRKIT